MPLPETIETNKTAIATIVAGLFALLGLTAGAVISRIPKALHATIIRALRPAESAARRLIWILALNIKVKAPKPRPRPTGLARAEKRKPGKSFALFDPRPRFLRKRKPKDAPRRPPSITFFRHGEYRRVSFGPEPRKRPADGLENSQNIIARLQALKAALENLPHQAVRMARALARHETSPRLKFRKPLRPGPAPGARKKPVHDVDHVLERCHWLAREALAPNTS